MNYFTCIVLCSNNWFYVGHTNNLEKDLSIIPKRLERNSLLKTNLSKLSGFRNLNQRSILSEENGKSRAGAEPRKKI